VVTRSAVSAGDLAIAVALALADLLLAGWIFARPHRRALATGLIARYSAETVT
jgi:ABC-2 type transport system permease protein